LLSIGAVACGSGESGLECAPQKTPGLGLLIAFDNDGDMHCLDPDSGRSQEILDTRGEFDRGDFVEILDLGRVSSAVWHEPLEALFIGLGGNSPARGLMMRLYLEIGLATTIRNFESELYALPGMAAGTTNGWIYMPQADDSGVARYDPGTDTYEQLNTTAGSDSGNGITFALDGRLYQCGNNHLYEIDPANGNGSDLGALTYNGFPRFESSNPPIVAMTTRPADGVIFCFVKDGGGRGNISSETYLCVLDPITRVLTHRGKTQRPLEGLAFVPDGLVSIP